MRFLPFLNSTPGEMADFKAVLAAHLSAGIWADLRMFLPPLRELLGGACEQLATHPTELLHNDAYLQLLASLLVLRGANCASLLHGGIALEQVRQLRL